VKKSILSAVLVLMILASLLSGTLAVYTKTIDVDTPAGVVAKEFIFLADGTESFQTGVKIAPTETVAFAFGVRNHDGISVTETTMRYDIEIEVGAAPGKSAIGPLVVSVKDGAGNTIDSLTGTGTLYVSGLFPLSASGRRHGYIIEFHWPSTENDTDFAGDDFGTELHVSATAVQVADSVYLLDDCQIRMGEGGHRNFAYEYLGGYKNIVIPAAVGGAALTNIYQDSFAGRGLKSVYFEQVSGVRRIHARAFADNDLKEITLPPSLERIDYGAFMDNPNLTTVRIGANVELEGNVFQNSDKFKDAYYNTYSRGAGTYVYENGNWIKR